MRTDIVRWLAWVLATTVFVAAPPVLAEEPKPPARGMFLVAHEDCGDPGAQPHLTSGANWTLTDDEKQGQALGADRYQRFAYHEQAVTFRFVGLRPEARYMLRVHYFNVSHERTVRLTADDEELHGPLGLPKGRATVRVLTIPRQTYRDAVLKLTCARVAGHSAMISAVELWSDVEGLLGPAGSFVRFRVDQLPEGQPALNITAVMKIYAAPWVLSGLTLTPQPVTEAGWTPWVDLRKLPGGANGSLVFSIPAGARGLTRFSVVQDEAACVRDIDWNEPDGTRIIVSPDFSDVRTFRDQERRYYERTLLQTGGRLFPLARPPLLFSNAWGHTTGGAAEYMVKTFRLLGLNSVETSEDAAKYEKLYGWRSQGGQYGPPGFMPYDEAKARAQFEAYYRDYFTTGKGAGTAPGMRIFQLADEPGEIAIQDTPEARAGFHGWLEDQHVAPSLFGKKSWDEVGLRLAKPVAAEEMRLYYWSRRYQNYLTPKMFALAAEAVRTCSPSPDVQSYVALSGHALYMPSRMPLDMFQLAQYPGLMPGISDWMTSGSWNWDSHQAVAFSVAPYNAGARRYGADFGKRPLSFPMMHCVYPSLFRAYTQLANQCKFISYYNYGPDYEVTEGYWSDSWKGQVVHRINNRAAQMDDILGPGLMRPSRVAMLYTAPQEIWWPQGSFADKRASFLALSHHYFQPELVTEQQVLDGALAHYDALYVLDQFVSRDVQERIEGWVKDGGLLWACADAAVCDEYTEPYDLLDRMAGLKRDNSTALSVSVDIIPAQGENMFSRHEVPPLGRKRELIRPGVFTCPEARIRATYSDNHPAWAEKQIGKGKLVYIGHRCGLSYSRRAGARGEYKWWPWDGRRELLFKPLLEAGIERELTLSAPLVMAMPLSTADGTVIVLFNMFHVEQTDLTLTLKEPARPHSVQWCDEQLRLVDLPYDYVDGRMIITGMALPQIGAMIVVRREPAPPDDRLERMRQDAERHVSSTDWQTASAGAWFAGFFPDWQLAPRIVPLLKHEHWAARRSAAEAIGRLRYAAAAGDLRKAIDNETDPHALADELVALVQLRHPDARKLCEEYRAHTDPFIRQEARRATALLASMGEGK